MSDESRVNEGNRIRREVLGAEHVQRSLDRATSFSRPMQELVTEYCWGEIWGDETLSRRERSLLNLGMLAALNRSHELGVHVRGAVQNGLSPEEIRAALLQVAIYAGVPAGIEATRVAEAVLVELGLVAPAGE
jgi:4-carboxymuconolactone decarboxylase